MMRTNIVIDDRDFDHDENVLGLRVIRP